MTDKVNEVALEISSLIKESQFNDFEKITLLMEIINNSIDPNILAKTLIGNVGEVIGNSEQELDEFIYSFDRQGIPIEILYNLLFSKEQVL